MWKAHGFPSGNCLQMVAFHIFLYIKMKYLAHYTDSRVWYLFVLMINIRSLYEWFVCIDQKKTPCARRWFGATFSPSVGEKASFAVLYATAEIIGVIWHDMTISFWSTKTHDLWGEYPFDKVPVLYIDGMAVAQSRFLMNWGRPPRLSMIVIMVLHIKFMQTDNWGLDVGSNVARWSPPSFVTPFWGLRKAVQQPWSNGSELGTRYPRIG